MKQLMPKMKSVANKLQNDKIVLSIIKPHLVYGPWIAGGAAIKWYNGQNVDLSDIDVFCRTDEQYNNVFDSLKRDEFSVVCQTPNATTFKFIGWDEDIIFDTTVQLVKKTYESCESVLNDFDIVACKIATDGVKFEMMEGVKDHIATKTLHTVNVRPSLPKRFGKYYAYGYKPTKETLEALLFTETEIDFSNMDEYDHV